jgi:hypothetical protein
MPQDYDELFVEDFGLGAFWMSATYGPEYWDPSDSPGYDFELLILFSLYEVLRLLRVNTYV